VKIEPVAQSIAALPALKNGQLDVIAGANYVTFQQAVRGTGMTILFVTHDIDETVYVGVVLGRDPGRVIADRPVDLPREREQIARLRVS